jgi:hypothetical protein
MPRCRRRARRRLPCRIQAVAVLRTSVLRRTAAVRQPADPVAVAKGTSVAYESPAFPPGSFFGAGSLRVQFEKVLPGQISSIVTSLPKAVGIHSGQRGTGG